MSDDMPTVEKPAEGAPPAPAGKSSALPEAEITRLTDEIVTALKTVYDPEIPADIYEIGLIYRIDIAEDCTVKVDMSLTSPNCRSWCKTQFRPCQEWERSMSAWSGTRPGTRAGCRKRRASSSTCSENDESMLAIAML
jgi:Iron-sulfur cluster assembly protein